MENFEQNTKSVENAYLFFRELNKHGMFFRKYFFLNYAAYRIFKTINSSIIIFLRGVPLLMVVPLIENLE